METVGRAFRSGAAVTLALVASSASAAAPSVSAGRVSGAIHLDGRLDDDAWRSAPVITLTQQSPQPGAPTPYATEVRVLVSGDVLYFGFTCRDPHPERLSIHSMRRDSELNGDDTVAIVLDTYGDRRTGYFFQINAAGARVDGLISNPEHPSLDWDGIWDARTARTPDGWTAEIVIPSRTLNFSRALAAWGFNVERSVPRERLVLRWSSPTLDSFLYDFSRAGTLGGVGVLQQGKGVEVTPYASGRSNEVYGVSPRDSDATGGADIAWKATPQLTTVLTINTDFAETEADTRQINLTRFALFFPEKRAFFLEGANQYTFAGGLRDQFVPFFSRTIGLLSGVQIPVNAGVKVDGRAGRWNLAVLDVQTRETIIPPAAGEELTAPTVRVSGTNLLAGRVSYDVNGNLRVGTIVTHGDPEARRDNTFVGVDGVWQTSNFRGNKNLLLSAWTAATRGDSGPGSSAGWGARVDYPNDLFDCNASVNQYGDALDPLLGFLPRPGTRQTSLGCNYQPRPPKHGPFRWIRQQFFENRYHRVTSSRGFVESWDYFMAPINFRMETGDRFEFNWNPRGETLVEPFEISPGVVIPAGSYTYTRWRVEAQTSGHRPLQFGTTTWFGGFYDGHLTEQTNYIKWTSPAGRVQLEADAENDFARLAGGHFVQRLWQVQGAYAWSPDLVLTSFVQYDTASENVGTNTRLRWTIRPGNDLFIVWNRGWQRPLADPERPFTRQADLLAVKLRWTFRY